MKKFGLIALLLSFSAVLFAAEPKPELPDKLVPKSKSFVTWKPGKDSGVVQASYLPWGHDLEPFPMDIVGGDPRSFLVPLTGVKPATYKYLATFTGDKGELVQKFFDVPVGDNPNPPVPPTPVPPPDPQPANGEVTSFVVVEDTSKAGQWRGDIFGDTRVAQLLQNKKIDWTVLSTGAKGPGGDRPADLATFINFAESKTLPYLFTFDKNGGQLYAGPCPIESPSAFLGKIAPSPQEPDKPRAMGNKVPEKLMRKWAVFGSTPETKLIPREQWKETNLGALLPDVKDQDGIGACNAFATITAVEAARRQSGQNYVRLSCGWLYGRINGGVDQGSMLEDGLAHMLEVGTCKNSTVGDLDWRKNPAAAKEEAKNFKVIEAYICPSFDHMASALQQGFLVIEGLPWYDNFRTDSEGWLPSRGSGNWGGHALCGYGVAKRGNVWGIRTRNSWGASWGIAGNCIIPESLFGETIGGFWAVRAVTWNGDKKLPTPKLSSVELKRPEFDRELSQLKP